MKIHLDADEINEMLSEFPDNEHFVTQEQLNRPCRTGRRVIVNQFGETVLRWMEYVDAPHGAYLGITEDGAAELAFSF